MKSLAAFFLWIGLIATAHTDEKTCRCCSTGSSAWKAAWEWEPMQMSPRPARWIQITTDSPESQLWFDQGLYLLHAFDELEALACFRKALEHDPDCAMAHWGVIMALPSGRFDAAEQRLTSLKLAQDQAIRTSPTEQAFLRAASHLLGSGTTLAIAELLDFCGDGTSTPDAAAFAAYWMRDGYDTDGQPNTGTVRALEVLRKHLAAHPTHPGLNHYLIHLLESGPDYAQALPAARFLQQSATQASHLQHMIGHLHFRAGRYAEANRAFEKTDALEQQYFATRDLAPTDHANHVHNLFFWTMSSALAGEKDVCNELLTRLNQLELSSNPIASHESALLLQLRPIYPSLLAYSTDDAAAAMAKLPSPPPSDLRAEILYSAVQAFLALELAIQSADPSAANAHWQQLSNDLKRSKALQPASKFTAQAWSRSQAMINLLYVQARAAHKAFQSPRRSSETWKKLAISAEAKLGYFEPPLLPWQLSSALAEPAADD